MVGYFFMLIFVLSLKTHNMKLSEKTVEELTTQLLFAESQEQENAIINELKSRGVL